MSLTPQWPDGSPMAPIWFTYLDLAEWTSDPSAETLCRVHATPAELAVLIIEDVVRYGRRP